jgi:myo-inositol catabolism protein IolC
VIYDAFELSVADGVDARTAGLLVDEQFGADVARRARARGFTLAMPVEQSGRDEFDFEFGADFGTHIEDFDPTYAKVLVRYDADGDAKLNRRQAARLRTLSDWLRERDRKLLLELLVPDRRPELVVRAMRELQAAGVEPYIWKIEGLDRRDDCVRAADQARDGGRDHVTCIVLGRGADEQQVQHWLAQAAGVPGFVGFAVGRTLWWEELVLWVGGEIGGAEASARIAANYGRLVEAWPC